MSDMFSFTDGHTRRQRFLYGFENGLQAAQEKALEPPPEPDQEDCKDCEGTGFLNNDPCWGCDSSGKAAPLTREDIARIKADERDDDRRGK
jgi:hypothetical protein